jgi:hypothetical protein
MALEQVRNEITRCNKILNLFRARESTEDRRRARLNRDFQSTLGTEMEFTDEEAKYMSQPGETLQRNIELQRLFNQRKDITIIDAFACVGGDSVSFMHAFDKCRLYAVQQTLSDEESKRFLRLTHNVTKYNGSPAKASEVNFYPTPIQTALPAIAAATSNCVDLLYLDPPWFDGAEKIGLEGMVTFLQSNVFCQLGSTGLRPSVICMKVDFPASDIQASQTFQTMLHGYAPGPAVDVIRFKSRPPAYSYYIFHKNQINSVP